MLGLGISVAITVACALSFNRYPACFIRGLSICLINGGLLVQDDPVNRPIRFVMARVDVVKDVFGALLNVWFRLPKNRDDGSIYIPLGLPLATLAVVSTIVLWKTRKRIPEGHCRQCGYYLTGNESGVCPECGANVNGEQAALD